MIDLKNITLKEKIELFKTLYKDISSKGIKGDSELAHINEFEARLLKMYGGAGTINEETGLRQYFGGGGSSGGGGGAAPDTTTQFVREAPGIEERKLELMDIARSAAEKPLYANVPDVRVAGLGALEQQGIQQAGTTGVGTPTTQAGIGSILQGQQATLQGQQAAFAGPNISQFYNPYQSYVLDEINRQAEMAQNQLAGQAVQAGAFGGGREGVQRAEQERARLGAIGQAQQTGFNTALGAAQQQQGLQAQTGLQAGQQLGQAGQQLGQLGVQQQAMSQADINQLMASGGLQRQLTQQALDAERQSALQKATEPLQRVEFLSNVYAAGPKSTSGITAATAPTTSPLAQSLGSGLGAYATYQALQPKATA
jgi:hypothetical protein